MKKLFGFSILIIGLVIGSKVVFDYYSFLVAPIEHKFYTLWAKDMELLESEKKLPIGWSEITDIKYHLLTENVKKWKGIKAPISIKKDGTHRLEVTITDWIDKMEAGIVVQYHLIDKKSGDMVAEFGRTFVLENSTVKTTKNND